MCATASAERPGETVKPPTRRAPRALSPSSQCSRGGSRALPSQRAGYGMGRGCEPQCRRATGSTPGDDAGAVRLQSDSWRADRETLR